MRKVKSLLKQTTPLQICFAPFLNSPETAMVHVVCFSSYGQFGVCEPQRSNYYVLLAQEHLLRKLEKTNPQKFLRCGSAG